MNVSLCTEYSVAVFNGKRLNNQDITVFPAAWNNGYYGSDLLSQYWLSCLQMVWLHHN